MVQMINAVTPLAAARAELAATYDLGFSKAVEKATAAVFDRLRGRVPAIEWPLLAPLIFQISRLKRQRDAVILAHRYQVPAIYFGVADITGDAEQLALAAAAVEQPVIVQCGVHFMAETSKVLNPGRTVLLPDSRAGCSLAASITPEDVRALRARYPGLPLLASLSTPAGVKALADACCTPGNALAMVEAMPGDAVILVPDQYLARNLAPLTRKRLITWAGACEVHESFTATDIAELRAAYPSARVLVHSQCRPEVVAAADYAGATAGMIDWISRERPARVIMVTECSVSDILAAETEGVEFVRGCNICPHMKRITLENILWSLHTLGEEIRVAPEIAEPAARAVHRMLELAGRDRETAR